MTTPQPLASPSRGTLVIIGATSIVILFAATHLYENRSKEAKHGPQSEGLRRAGAIRRARRLDHASRGSVATEPNIDGTSLGDQTGLVANVAPAQETELGDGATVETTELADNASGVAAEDDNETEHSIADEDAYHVNASHRRSVSKLREMTYYIAQNRELETGVVHRGITCDACNVRPIRGIRYRCANCEDFDLCEGCEATNEHAPTHVFYKMRVPCFWGPGKTEPIWFPGMPHRMPSDLPSESLTHVLESLTFLDEEQIPDESEIKGWYQQYICLADEPFPIDRVEYDMERGISRAAFRYLLPVTRRGALAFNRLFAIFDRNNDGLISFEEFAYGAMLVNMRRSFPSWKRSLFKALDVDRDGFIDRHDLLRMYESLHEIAEDVTICHLRLYNESDDERHLDDRRTLRDFVETTRPLPNYFTYHSFDQLHRHRENTPFFNQLTGPSQIPNDDSSSQPLFSDAPDSQNRVDQPPETAVASFIRSQLSTAFNELLDPIFSEHEQYVATWQVMEPLSEKYSALIGDYRLLLKAVNSDLSSNPSLSRATVDALRILSDGDEERERMILQAFEAFTRYPGKRDGNTICIAMVEQRLPYSFQRSELAADLLRLATAMSTTPRWRDNQHFKESYERQLESVWNPRLRHDTLEIYPGLLHFLLELILRFENRFANAHEQVKAGKMDSKLFWTHVDRAREIRERSDDEHVQDPLPLLDLLGLVVI